MIRTLTGLVFSSTWAQVDEATKRAEKVGKQNLRLAFSAQRWRDEAKQLRRITHMLAIARIVDRAHESALQLCVLHLNSVRTGRTVACQYGVSERYYFWGRAMCELASIYAKGEFIEHDPAIMERQLLAARNVALEDFSLLVRWLPPSRRPKMFRSTVT